LVFSYGP